MLDLGFLRAGAARFCRSVTYFVQDTVFPMRGAARFLRSEADSVHDYSHWSTAPPLYKAVCPLLCSAAVQCVAYCSALLLCDICLLLYIIAVRCAVNGK